MRLNHKFDLRAASAEEYSLVGFQQNEPDLTLVVYEAGLSAGAPFRREIWRGQSVTLPERLSYLPDGSAFMSGVRPSSRSDYEAHWIPKGLPSRQLASCDRILNGDAIWMPDGALPMNGIMRLAFGMNCSLPTTCEFGATGFFYLFPDGAVTHACRTYHPTNAPYEWVQTPDGTRLAGPMEGSGRWMEVRLDPRTNEPVSTNNSDVPTGPMAWVDAREGATQAAAAFVGPAENGLVLAGHSVTGQFVSQPIAGTNSKTGRPFNAVTVGRRLVWATYTWERSRWELLELDPDKRELRHFPFAPRLPLIQPTRESYRLATNGRELFAIEWRRTDTATEVYGRRLFEYVPAP